MPRLRSARSRTAPGLIVLLAVALWAAASPPVTSTVAPPTPAIGPEPER